jgi:hypothetical protein
VGTRRASHEFCGLLPDSDLTRADDVLSFRDFAFQSIVCIREALQFSLNYGVRTVNLSGRGKT